MKNRVIQAPLPSYYTQDPIEIKIQRKKVGEGPLAMGDSRGPVRGRIFGARGAYSHKI
jgi:hypothetical protein